TSGRRRTRARTPGIPTSTARPIPRAPQPRAPVRSRSTPSTYRERRGHGGARTADVRRSSHPDDRHEAHTPPRRAAQVVREAELRALDLPRTRLAAQLEPHLEHLLHHATRLGARA